MFFIEWCNDFKLLGIFRHYYLGHFLTCKVGLGKLTMHSKQL